MAFEVKGEPSARARSDTTVRDHHRHAAAMLELAGGDLRRRMLAALDDRPGSIDALAACCGVTLGEASLALEQLAMAGLAGSEHGWWARRWPPLR